MLGLVLELECMDLVCLCFGCFEWIVNLCKLMFGECKFLFFNNVLKSFVKVDNNIVWNYFGLMIEGFINGEVVIIVNNLILKVICENIFMYINELLSEGLSSIFVLYENMIV